MHGNVLQRSPLLLLPAELREQIWLLALDNGATAIRPKPPPLTQVSRLIRADTIPIFCSRFTLEMENELCYEHRIPYTTSTLRLRSRREWRDIPAETLQQVKRLEVLYGLYDPSNYDQVRLTFAVTLDERLDHGAAVHDVSDWSGIVGQTERARDLAWLEDMASALRGKLWDKVVRFASKGGRCILRAVDLDRFVDIGIKGLPKWKYGWW